MCNRPGHQGLIIGEIYHVVAAESICGKCNSSSGVLDFNGIYLGHESVDGVEYAMLNYLQSHPCPGCGRLKQGASSQCGGGHYFQIETAIPVENWPIKKDVVT